MVNSDLVKERKGTLRLRVIPNNGSHRRPSILHRRDSSDQSGTSTLGALLCVVDCRFLEVVAAMHSQKLTQSFDCNSVHSRIQGQQRSV
jgi:hypothetical protein